jgi:hypothetical protein
LELIATYCHQEETPPERDSIGMFIGRQMRDERILLRRALGAMTGS